MPASGYIEKTTYYYGFNHERKWGLEPVFGCLAALLIVLQRELLAVADSRSILTVPS